MDPQYLHHLYSIASMGVNSTTKLSRNSRCRMTPTGKISRKYKSPEEREKGDPGRWTSDEHMRFLEGLKLYGKDWRKIADLVRTRSIIQIRTHAQKYLIKERKAREVGHSGTVMMDGKGILSPMEQLIRDTEKISKQALKEQERQMKKTQKRFKREELKKIKQEEKKKKKQKGQDSEKNLDSAPINNTTENLSHTKDVLVNYNNYGNFPLGLQMPLKITDSLLDSDVKGDVLSLVKTGLLPQGTDNDSALSLIHIDQEMAEPTKKEKKVSEKMRNVSSNTVDDSQNVNNIVSILDNKQTLVESSNSFLFPDFQNVQNLNLKGKGDTSQTLNSFLEKSLELKPLEQPTILRKLSMQDSTNSTITAESANTSLGPAYFSDSTNSALSTYSTVTKKLAYLNNSKTNILEMETPGVKLLDIDYHHSFNDDLRLNDIDPLMP